MYDIFFIYSFTDGHLGGFHVLAIVNNLQWTWGYRYLFKTVISFPLDKYLEVELLDRMVVLFLIFWGTSILFSVIDVPAYFPTNSAQGSVFSTSSSTVVISCLFDNSHSNRC